MDKDDGTDKGATGLNRRQFVEKSTLLAGGTMLGGVLGGCADDSPEGASAVASVAHAGGSGTLRLAVIGCGGRGTGAVNNALKADRGVQLVAVADAFADAARECAGKMMVKYGDKRVTVTPETTFVGFDAFRKAIDLADVVILATPPGFRPEHFEYAVAKNRHVFMEKPVATDAHGVRRVLAAARSADEKKLSVVAGLQRRYQPSYLETLQRYRDGSVGEIVSGQVYWNGSGVWVRERESGQSEMEYQMRNWYYFNWLCGDHIVEQHIHNIDVANWFIGDYPVSAQGMGGRQVRTGKDHGQIFDHHFVEFTYPTGAVISSQCRHMPGCQDMVEERFQATGGSIYTNGRWKGEGIITSRAGNEIYNHTGLMNTSAYQVELDVLFASIRGGEHVNNAEYAANSSMTAIMGRMATYSGKRIDWGEALASGHRLVPDSDKLDWDANPPVMPDDQGRYPVPVPGKTSII